MAGLTSLFALEGRWRLTREITHADGSINAFDGETRFHRSGARLVQDEDGWLTMAPDQPRLRATRRYLWTQHASRLECAFADGRPFHTVPLNTECPETTYLCPPDRYRVAYDFTGFPDWRATWHVEGPQKDYVMRSRYAPAGR